MRRRLIKIFKTLTGRYDNEATAERLEINKTRGKNEKLIPEKLNLEQRIFSRRFMDSFKTRVDQHWQEHMRKARDIY